MHKDAALPLAASCGKTIRAKHDLFYRTRAIHAGAKISLRKVRYLTLSAGRILGCDKARRPLPILVNIDFCAVGDTVMLVQHDEEQHKILKELLHEMRTPLAALSYDARDANQIAALAHIQNLCARYEKIITDSYKVVKQRVNLREIIREVLEMIDGAHDADLSRMLREVPQTYVQADPLLLRQVLINIVTNAREHGQGTSIRLGVEAEGADHILVRIANSMALEVDTTKIEEFGTKNWGVGLPLAAELVASMDGEMRVLVDEDLWAVEVRLRV